MQVNQIIQGSALEVLKTWPSESVNCCISSPPYWALRDYGVDGQLGIEPTFEEYIDKLCSIYDEVFRVLRKDGCVFVNLGDTYSNKSAAGNKVFGNPEFNINRPSREKTKTPAKNPAGIPEKSLCLIPQRFAIEMVNRGWTLRNVIIWHKPNPMPSSAKDRFTVDFEQVFFFVKGNSILWHFRPGDGKVSDRQPDYKSGIEGLDWEWGMRKGKRVKLSLWQGFKYFFEPQYEATGREATWEEYSKADGHKSPSGNLNDGVNAGFGSKKDSLTHPLGRNKRTVWTIPTQSFPDAHFATFPEKLVEPMILSGCPEFVCTKCGKGRKKVYEKGDLVIPSGRKSTQPKEQREIKDKGWNSEDGFAAQCYYHKYFKGYTDCGCGAEWRPGIVLDPFGGVFTTALVAYKNKRDYVMIELKPEYIEIGKNRLAREKEKFGLFE